MPDAERAKILGLIAVGMILALLYVLGGVSVYLHVRYLRPNPPSPGLTATPVTTRVLATATPTLFPTLTKRAAMAFAAQAPLVTAATLTWQEEPMVIPSRQARQRAICHGMR